ncbi:MAG: YfcZ/YiiS family protein [Plesiomonas sp.]|uniref:YfcZ/YiiS family protein n=1 Tax=Plesiomonas sp. TaxID=2486279 RepID=UPI003EE6D9C7
MSNENICRVQETAACCCVDVGTILDNTDCTAKVEQQFATRADAEAFLAKLTKKARDIESDACEITSSLTDNAEGAQLNADFTFSCQAETMIFQLALR